MHNNYHIKINKSNFSYLILYYILLQHHKVIDLGKNNLFNY